MTNASLTSPGARPTDHQASAAIATEAGHLLLDLRHALDDPATDPADVRAAGDRVSHELHRGRSSPNVSPTTPCSPRRVPTTPARLGAERVWIVDPLDGTREFGEAGRTDWAVHVALVDGRAVVAAAVGAARPRPHPRHRSGPALPPPRRRSAALVVSRTRPPAVAEQLRGALGGELVPLGSAGAKAMAVVLGDADVYAHSGGQYEWDSAAPVGVAAAAGLHVSRLDGVAARLQPRRALAPRPADLPPRAGRARCSRSPDADVGRDERASPNCRNSEEHREDAAPNAGRVTWSGSFRAVPGADRRRGDHPDANAPATAQSMSPSIQCATIVGTDRGGRHQRRARGAGRGEAEPEHEQRHEQEATAVGQWAGSGRRLAGALGGLPWPAAYAVLVVAYVVLHYLLVSQTAHVLALFGVFLGVGAPLGVPVPLLGFALLFLDELLLDDHAAVLEREPPRGRERLPHPGGALPARDDHDALQHPRPPARRNPVDPLHDPVR